MKLSEMNIFDGVFKGKKVLITGNTGFKGSWLSIWLKELGASVYGYALPPQSDNDNFTKLELDKKTDHRSGDIRDLVLLKKRFEEVQPDIAFHLAAQPIVTDSYENPQYTFETNMMGTVNFLESIKHTESVKSAVVVTSDKCYQNNEWVWGYKETDKLGGDDPYSASKGCAEIITNSYVKSFFSRDGSCNISTARAGNVIGGGDWAKNRIVPDFFRSVLKNEKLVLRYPYASRPWQFVLEPLSGYMYLASKLFQNDKKFLGAWNFGPLDSNHYTVADLINRLIKSYGAGQIEMLRKDDAYHETSMLKLDISKAMKYLEWRPVLNFDETVQFTVEGYENELTSKDLYDKRLGQISYYIKKAQSNRIKWSACRE